MTIYIIFLLTVIMLALTSDLFDYGFVHDHNNEDNLLYEGIDKGIYNICPDGYDYDRPGNVCRSPYQGVMKRGIGNEAAILGGGGGGGGDGRGDGRGGGGGGGRGGGSGRSSRSGSGSGGGGGGGSGSGSGNRGVPRDTGANVRCSATNTNQQLWCKQKACILPGFVGNAEGRKPCPTPRWVGGIKLPPMPPISAMATSTITGIQSECRDSNDCTDEYK